MILEVQKAAMEVTGEDAETYESRKLLSIDSNVNASLRIKGQAEIVE
ncbi:hypothetical protein H310_14567 [Aphanomyces invadans]|uniref:Uncharacterized protein n=1 Tax=Aphanomyces invadans TaxID=157072 RepID=A0A024T9E7_9STRA|nr:hypothetical protein H310_14567 [Aphanomyces invadans]ETV90673.1 hypothetical protein H310_14567 [Aphanomyces invadans]|eukprot:XP_008880670.1 hypothetical protein H310_14567 [Aphanomyces invadans]